MLIYKIFVFLQSETMPIFTLNNIKPMKNKSLKKTALMAAMMFCIIPVFSQSVIYNPEKDSEFSIIRNYKDNIDITYNVFESQTSFNYVDRSSLTEISAEVTGFTVNDFVIFDDTVFFCGSTAYSAVYGYFDINDVFFSGGQIKYRIVFIPFTPIPTYSEITQFLRIDVMRTVAGKTHMLMVGEGMAYDENSKDSSRLYFYPGVIVDLLVNSVSDQMYYFIDRDNLYRFDDVTITEKYAVVSGHTVSSNYAPVKYNIFYYPNPTNLDSYFTSLFIPGTYDAVVPMWTADPLTLQLPYNDGVLITKMDNDGFATLCHKYDAVGNDYLTLSVYSNPSVIPTYRMVLPYYDNCQEMVYNSSQKKIYSLAGWNHILYSIPMPFTATERIMSFEDNPWMSIDNADGEKYEILSGYVAPAINGKRLWRYDETAPNEDPCIQYSRNRTLDIGINDISSTTIQKTAPNSFPRTSFIPNLSTIPIQIICGK